MQQTFNQILHFAQQGIAAVFRFVELIWSWSLSQVTKVLQTPWQSWPLWKQILLALVVAGIAWVMYKVVKELWESGERTLAAFAGLLGAFIKTLPMVLVAGIIALAGIWVLNNVDLSSLRLPAGPQLSKG